MFCAIVGTLIAASIAAAISAVFLRAAAVWVAKAEITFGDAFKSAFIAALSGAGVAIVLGLVIDRGLAQLAGQLVAFLVLTGLLQSALGVGMGKSALVAVVAILLQFVVIVGVVFAVSVLLVGSKIQ